MSSTFIELIFSDFEYDFYFLRLFSLTLSERQLVHEWAHLQYGVFDEYGIPGSKRYPMFYHENGRVSISKAHICYVPFSRF